MFTLYSMRTTTYFAAEIDSYVCLQSTSAHKHVLYYAHNMHNTLLDGNLCKNYSQVTDIIGLKCKTRLDCFLTMVRYNGGGGVDCNFHT